MHVGMSCSKVCLHGLWSMDRFVSQSHDLITRAGRRLVGVSVLPLFIIRADGGHVEVSALCYFFFFVLYLICKPPSHAFWACPRVIWNGARTGLHLNQTKQISTTIFTNALVETLFNKTRRQRFIRALRELQKNRTNCSFSLHVIFKRKTQHCTCLLWNQ